MALCELDHLLWMRSAGSRWSCNRGTLRVLQEREFERAGSRRTLRSDARLIAATNADLVALVEAQKFRGSNGQKEIPGWMPPCIIRGGRRRKGSTMRRPKIGLVIPHPEEQKWDHVWKIFRMPNLTLPTLAALIPEEDWDIEIQDELAGPLVFDRAYDLVLITVTTSVAVRAYEAARLFRQHGATVVLGGIHPSALPDEAAQHADAVVIGEGELTLPRLLDDFRRGQLQTFYRMPHMVDQWDRRPPRWDLLPPGYAWRESLTATRGCNYRCTFCSIHLALGAGQYGYRAKTPAAVAAMVEQCSGSRVMFWDDDLLSDPSYTKALCEALKPLQRSWMSQMSATYVAQHPEMLKVLAESGCGAMFMGLESISQESLKSVQKQNTAKMYEALIRRVHDYGIDIHAGFVCGLDHH